MAVELPEVTLIACTSVALDATARALSICLSQANFGKALLLSDRPPAQPLDARVEWRKINQLKCRADYSRFMLGDLADHVNTTHALCVQWDGYVLHGARWNPAFLEYDYIGAVWPQFSDGGNVGNGGFSLRSKRLLRATQTLQCSGYESEDVLIGRTYRQQLENEGIRFAPERIARQFAYERTPPTGEEFGFHGAFNLVRYLSAEDALRLFRSLEPRVLSRREHKELLRWTLNRGYWKLALVIALRLLEKSLLLR